MVAFHKENETPPSMIMDSTKLKHPTLYALYSANYNLNYYMSNAVYYNQKIQGMIGNYTVNY